MTLRRGDIIAALREAQNDSANIRGWLDAVDVKISELIERLDGAPESPAPTEIEYDRRQLDEPPRVRSAEPLCGCDEPAVYKSGVGKNNKPWAAYFCAKRRDDPMNCGFKQWID